MPHCPACGFPLPEDSDRAGARCPHCREPLYQPPGRFPRDARDGEAACSVHPGSESIGTCSRCGNFMCVTCRTRRGDRVLCVACIDRSFRAGDQVPGQMRVHSRQAAFGLSGGVAAWMLTAALVGISFLIRARGGAPGEVASVVMGLLLLVLAPATVGVAFFGLGFSAAALRMRGDSMILATLGLLLSGLHIGALVGLLLFTIWLH
jgi:hypothetical protein